MARPIKKGIDYFPMDVDFLGDMKVRKIKKACGSTGVVMLIYLLGNIYKDEGYYMKWDEEVRFLVADDIGTSELSADELVKKAVGVGFFDKGKFDKYKILTSHGIQIRYKKASYKKIDNSIDKDFDLINDDDKGVSDTGNPVSDDDSTQRKEKEIKEEEIKEKEIKEEEIKEEEIKEEEIKGEEIILNNNKREESYPFLYGDKSALTLFNKYADEKDKINGHQIEAAALLFLNHSVAPERVNELIIMAIQEARSKNAVTWAFVRGILKNWYKDNYGYLD